MILNDKTQEEFGYTFETCFDKNLVYCQCDYCNEIIIKKKVDIKRCRKVTPEDCCGNFNCIKLKRAKSCLSIYGVENPMMLDSTKDKIKANNLEKYGVEHTLQIPTIRNQIKSTNLKKYGVENPFQAEEIKEKIKQIHVKTLGVEYPSQSKEIQNKIKANNLEKYGVESTTILGFVQAKFKQTHLEKYGVEYPSQSKEIQNKIKANNLEKYGVEYPSQSKEIQNKIKANNLEKYGVESTLQVPEIREKIKQTNLEKYGVEYPQQNSMFVQKSNNTKLERYGTLNVNFGKSENKLKEWLNSFGFNFKSDITILEGKEIDMLDGNIGIEYCGLFWHTELSLSPRDKYYHYNKYKKSLDKGIQLITIFEDEWLYRENQCKNFIKSVLGKFETKIYARKCEIREINKEIANKFYDNYHIQGKVNSIKVSYGLYYQNELVGVMSLGNHHRQKGGLVLNRLCFKDGIQVIGGSSKLFSKCIIWAKENNYNKIISWSDNRWSLGKVYEQLEFSLEEELKPDYSYVHLKRATHRLSKQSFKKDNKNIPKEKTELEWATEKGYARIWDCGKKRWAFIIN